MKRMHRRLLAGWVLLLWISVGAGCQGSSAALVLAQKAYGVRQVLTLTNQGQSQPEKQAIWIALIHSFPPYQEVRSQRIHPSRYTLIEDELGNTYAEFDLSAHPPGSTLTVTIETEVVVFELGYDLAPCQGRAPQSLRDAFAQPELHIESANPQIVALAKDLSQGKESACQQVRAFYEYVGNELVYSYNGDDWGAQAALGPMGADCSEYAALTAALSRAEGIPARYFSGILAPSSGNETDEAQEHAWLDVYLPGSGWVALDPTLGRSSLARADYFAHYTPEHIIVSLGANPSVLRGSSYWTHLYWPGDSTQIVVRARPWEITWLK